MILLRVDMPLASFISQILMIEKIRFFFARYCSFIPTTYSNYRALQYAILHAHIAESERDIQNARQPSQTYSIYNKN